jgi:anaerobic carbon-monoxide dehydrogenase iron sulfur subunit
MMAVEGDFFNVFLREKNMKVLTPDLSKCKGVRACEKTCAKMLGKTDNPEHSAIRFEQLEGKPKLTVCNQCGECVLVCPTGALKRNKSGTVLLKKDLCVACYMCVGFCPENAMFKVANVLEPIKCISCGNCIKTCPKGALSFIEKDHTGLPA